MKYFPLILVLILIQMLPGQTRRIVLLEEATNASCSPCAYYNPGLQRFYTQHFGGVISVRYHAWWPGTDPMYQAAKDDCVNRIHYYNIHGVPNYVIDGHLEGVPASPTAMEEQMLERLAIPSPLKIRIQAEFTDDSVKARVSIVALDSINENSLYLRVAITQRMVSFVAPPGSNGEKEFPEVLRQMLPNALGTPLDSLAPGDSLSFRFSAAVKKDWEAGDLAVVAWVQCDRTKEVLQANIHFPTSIISEREPGLRLFHAQTEAKVPYVIFNDNQKTLHITLKLEDVSKPQDWDLGLEVNGQTGKVIPLEILPGDSAVFYLQVQSGEKGTASARIFAENDDDDGFYGEGYGYGYSVNFKGVVPENTDLLLVDDDGGKSYETNFTKALDALGLEYVTLEEARMSELAKDFDLTRYKMIIWNASWAFPAFTESDVNILSDYLNAGGSVAIFGQDVAWDVFDSNGQSHFPQAQTLLQKYFHLRFLENNSDGTRMEGVAGDPIGDGLSFVLARPYGSNNLMPDAIEPLDSSAHAVLLYDNDKIGAIRCATDSFRTTFFGISFEEIDDASLRQELLKRTIDWATGVTAVESSDKVLPQRFTVFPNYPNPFNPNTTIRFRLPAAGRVRVTVFNATGRVMRTWEQKLSAGEHRFVWDGTNAGGVPAATGIYLLRVEFAGKSRTRKMILLK